MLEEKTWRPHRPRHRRRHRRPRRRRRRPPPIRPPRRPRPRGGSRLVRSITAVVQ